MCSNKEKLKNSSIALHHLSKICLSYGPLSLYFTHHFTTTSLYQRRQIEVMKLATAVLYTFICTYNHVLTSVYAQLHQYCVSAYCLHVYTGCLRRRMQEKISFRDLEEDINNPIFIPNMFFSIMRINFSKKYSYAIKYTRIQFIFPMKKYFYRVQI